MERNKTKEQLEEEKKISLSFRIKPLAIEGFNESKLREKAQELWELIVKLETEKYDLEERQKRQDYDVSCVNSFESGCSAFFSFPLFWCAEDLRLHLWFMMFCIDITAERIEGTTETTTETQSSEEGSRPRGSDR